MRQAQALARTPAASSAAPERAAAHTPVAVGPGQRIAPLLSLVAREFEMPVPALQVHAAPFRRRPEATAAVLGDARLWLHPRLFDGRGRPAPVARELLAHEFVHLVQRQRGTAARAGAAAAELEAQAIARRVAEGRRAPRVRLALPAAASAFDVGFDQAVRLRYGAEIARIKRLLRGIWGFLWVSDGMVEEMLTILQSMDYVSAVSLLAGASDTADTSDAITQPEREKLLDELSDTHRERFRLQVLALHAALEDSVLQRADAGLFDGMDLSHLRPEEHASLARTLGLLPEPARDALARDEQRGEAVARILGTASSFDAEAERRSIAGRLREEAATRTRARGDIEADPALDAQYREVRRVLAAGPSEMERLVLLDLLQPWMREPDKLRAVSLQLQQDPEHGDLFESWLDDFPVQRLYAEPDRGRRVLGERRLAVLLRLLSFRDPWRNATFARALATQSWFLDIVNDEEAWLAMQLIGVLPEDMRTRLLADVGDEMLDNLSVSQREAAGANYYGGGPGGRDLAAIQSQLLDDTLWSVAHAGRLAGLVRMAIAARQHEWVFRRSQIQHAQRRQEYTEPDFTARIVEPFRLFNPDAVDANGQPAPRTDYSPELLNGVPWYNEGLLGSIDRYVVQTVDFMASSGSVALFRQSIGGTHLNAVEFQDIFGGSFMGIRFADFDSLGDEGAAAREAGRGANFIDDVAWDQSRGVLEMTATDLRVAAIRYPIGSLQFQTAGGRIGGLHLHMAYPSHEVQRPTSMHLHMDTLELSDLLLVGADSMTAINTVLAGMLNVDLGQDAIEGHQDEARRGYDFWSVALLPNLSRLIGFGDTVNSLTGFRTSGTQMSEGLLTPPTPTSLQVSIGSLSIDGVTTSSGQHIGRVEAHSLSLSLSGDLAGYLAALRRSQTMLGERLQALDDTHAALDEAARSAAEAAHQARRARLQAQRDATQALADQIEAAQARVAEAAPRAARGELAEDEAESLRADRELLDRLRRGGAVLDAGSLRVSGLEGAVSLEALELTDLHGMGNSSTALLGLLTDSDTLPRILQGEAFRPEVLAGREPERGDFAIDLGTVDLRGLSIHDNIPTPQEAQQDLDTITAALDERPWDRALREAAADATQRHEDAIEYARLAAIGISWLNSAETQTMRALHQRLTAREAFYAHHLHAEGAALTLSDSGRGIGLTAARLDAARGPDGRAGIRAGSLRIGEIHATNFRAGAAVEGGLLSAEGVTGTLPERLRRLGLAGDHLEVLDFEDTTGGLHFDRALLEGFDVAQDSTATTTSGSGDSERTHTGTLDARARLASIEGLGDEVDEAELLQRIEALEHKPAAERNDADRARIEAAHEALATFRGFVTLIEQLDERVRGAAGDAERREAETALADTLALFERWRRQLGLRAGEVHDLSVRVAGLGNFADPDFDLDAALESGVLVTGTGRSADGSRGDRIFSSAELRGARLGTNEAERITATEAAGSVLISNDVIELRQLALGRLELQGLYVEAGANQIWTSGVTVATGISVSGSLHFSERAPPEGAEPDAEREVERYLSSVVIDRLDIATLEGNGLSFYLASQQAMGEIESGTLGGIWAEGLTIGMPENGETTLRGDAGLRSLTDVRVNGMVQDALEFGRGRLNGSDLQIEFLASGGQQIRIGDLSLDEGDFRTADGRVRVSARHVSGTVVHEGTRWTLQDLRVPQLTLERLHWRSGAKTFVVDAPLTLAGLRVTASVDTAEAGNPAVHIDHLHADGLVGEHFRYEEPPLVVEVRQQTPWAGATSDATAFSRPAIEIGAIDIHDLDWTRRGGATAGTLDVASVHAALNVLREDLNVGAIVDTGALFVGFRRDGFDVSVADIGIETSGTLARGLPVGSSVDTHAGINGASTGLVRFYDDRIEAHDLFVERIDLHQFDFESSDYRLSIPEAGGQLQLDSISASVTVELDPEAESMTPTRIVVHRLDVPTLSAAGLEFTLKGVALAGGTRDITIRLPATPQTTATDLHLGAANPLGEGFVLTPQFNAVTGETEWLREGAFGLGTLDAAGLGLEIQGLLNLQTDAHVETLTLGMLVNGDWSLDVRQIDLTQLSADALGHHVEILGLPPHVADSVPGGQAGVSLTGLTRGAGGDWGLESAAVSGLVYRNAALGLTVEIASARLPQGFELPVSGPFTLPELTIDDAWFKLDDLGALLEPSTGGTGTATPGVTLANLNFLDALQGTVSLDVSLNNLPDFDVTLDIRNGVIDLDAFEDDTGGYDGVVDFDHDSGTLVLNIDWGNALMPLLGVIPGLVPQANYAASTWTGLDADEQALAEDDKARLRTLIGKRVPSSSGSGGPPDPDPFLQLHNIVGDLSLDETEVLLTKGAGTLVLGGGGHGGAEGIRVRGNIPSRLGVEIDRVGVSTRPGAPLNFDGTQVGLGSVVISGVRDVSLAFTGYTPGALEGRIDAARAEGITVQ